MAQMTTKHYNAFAGRIREQKQGLQFHDAFQRGKLMGLQAAAVAFAKVATNDNPRFDYDRFMEACGLKE